MATTTRNKRNFGLQVVLVSILFLSLLLPTTKTVGLVFSSSSDGVNMEQRKLMMLGSRPPQCVNKCLSCRPCMAALVIPPHHQKRMSLGSTTTTFMASTLTSTSTPISKVKEDQDDNYYLLSWRCRCGNKIYHP